jgi:hypothetical protein
MTGDRFYCLLYFEAYLNWHKILKIKLPTLCTIVSKNSCAEFTLFIFDNDDNGGDNVGNVNSNCLHIIDLAVTGKRIESVTLCRSTKGIYYLTQ